MEIERILVVTGQPYSILWLMAKYPAVWRNGVVQFGYLDRACASR